MASPLPEPFQLVDILGDGEILTCKAELRGEEVLVHVLPADPVARDRVIGRIARLPRNPDFLDRIEHQGHSLVVTRPRPELERFESWLDEMSPDDGGGHDPPPEGDATRLVLSIREHVGSKKAPDEEPAKSPPPPSGARPDETVAMEAPGFEPVDLELPDEEPAAGEDVSDAMEPPAEGPPADEYATPPMMAGMIGVPAAWSPDVEEEPATVEVEPSSESPDAEPDEEEVDSGAPTLEPRPSPVANTGTTSDDTVFAEGVGHASDEPPTLEPGPPPFDPDEPRTIEPRPAPVREGNRSLEGSARRSEAGAAEAPAGGAGEPGSSSPAPEGEGREGEEGTRRKTQLFLSMKPPGGSASPPTSPPAGGPTAASRKPEQSAKAPAGDATAASRRAPRGQPRASSRPASRPSPARPWYVRMEPLHVGLLAAAAAAVLVVLVFVL